MVLSRELVSSFVPSKNRGMRGNEEEAGKLFLVTWGKDNAGDLSRMYISDFVDHFAAFDVPKPNVIIKMAADHKIAAKSDEMKQAKEKGKIVMVVK